MYSYNYNTKIKKIQLNKTMSYSTFIHSGIVNPKKTKITKEKQEPFDVISMEISLLTKILESSRTEIKNDIELHEILSRMVNLKYKGLLTMKDYGQIIKKSDDELESIKRLAGI